VARRTCPHRHRDELHVGPAVRCGPQAASALAGPARDRPARALGQPAPAAGVARGRSHRLVDPARETPTHGSGGPVSG
jgi:hypothetical protein